MNEEAHKLQSITKNTAGYKQQNQIVRKLDTLHSILEGDATNGVDRIKNALNVFTTKDLKNDLKNSVEAYKIYLEAKVNKYDDGSKIK